MRFLIQGYIVQITSLLSLFSYNLLLPKLLGFENYGSMIYISAATHISISLFDYGYNLLTIKKKHQNKYLFCKYIWASLFLSIYSSYYLTSSSLPATYLIIIWTQTFLYTTFTHTSHLLIAYGRNDLAIKSSLWCGITLLAIPIGLQYLEWQTKFAPILSFAISLWINKAILLPKLPAFKKSSIIFNPLKPRNRSFLTKSFIQQIGPSSPNIIDSLTTWIAVTILVDKATPEEATSLRISLNIITTAILLLPIHRQSLYKKLIEKENSQYLKKYIAGTITLSCLACIGTILISPTILPPLYGENATLIVSNLSILAFVIPIKTILETATLFLFKNKRIATYFKRSLFLAPIFLASLTQFNIPQNILILNGLLCTTATITIFITSSNRTIHPPQKKSI